MSRCSWPHCCPLCRQECWASSPLTCQASTQEGARRCCRLSLLRPPRAATAHRFCKLPATSDLLPGCRQPLKRLLQAAQSAGCRLCSDTRAIRLKVLGILIAAKAEQNEQIQTRLPKRALALPPGLHARPHLRAYTSPCFLQSTSTMGAWREVQVRKALTVDCNTSETPASCLWLSISVPEAHRIVKSACAAGSCQRRRRCRPTGCPASCEATCLLPHACFCIFHLAAAPSG